MTDFRITNIGALSSVTHETRSLAEQDRNIQRKFIKVGDYKKEYEQIEGDEAGAFKDLSNQWWGMTDAGFFVLRKIEGVTDDDNIRMAIEYLNDRGGGTIVYAYSPIIKKSIELFSGIYHNLNGHTVGQSKGANVDIFKTFEFDFFSGIGPL